MATTEGRGSEIATNPTDPRPTITRADHLRDAEGLVLEAARQGKIPVNVARALKLPAANRLVYSDSLMMLEAPQLSALRWRVAAETLAADRGARPIAQQLHQGEACSEEEAVLMREAESLQSALHQITLEINRRARISARKRGEEGGDRRSQAERKPPQQQSIRRRVTAVEEWQQHRPDRDAERCGCE